MRLILLWALPVLGGLVSYPLAPRRSRLRVGPLEAIDGTPVLDVKPVLRSAACSLALPR